MDYQERGTEASGGVVRRDRRWDAFHNFMPPSPPRLRVTGRCTMPTPGYTLTLTRAEPQGINPEILVLDLHVEPPSGMVTQVLTPAVAEYYEETGHFYRQVEIRPDGVLVDVETGS
jgi:hypothetical protein